MSHKKELELNKKTLEKLYWKKGFSINKIAKTLGYSTSKIYYWFLKYKIKRKASFKKNLQLNKETLEKLYLKQRLSLNDISKKYGCKDTNILYWLKKFNIKRRPAYWKKIDIPKKVLEDLYHNKNLSTKEIAKKFGIKNRRTILKKMKKHGIPSKTLSEALTKNYKAPFSKNMSEKAYFLGLRTGDFYASQKHKSVRIQTTTTHLAQIDLLKKTIKKYGELRVYLSKNTARADEWFVYSDLDSSFSFLVEKPNKIPFWILEKSDYFYNFLSGYSDCEASFNIIKSHSNSVRFIYKITSGDKKILEQIKTKLESEDYHPRIYARSMKGKPTPYGKFRIDMFTLILYRKKEVLSLINKLLPLSNHSEKIRKINLILKNKNKNWIEISKKMNRLKSNIKKELLVNQIKQVK